MTRPDIEEWPPSSSGVTDHGALTGLGDDDHTIYALADGSRGTFEVAGAVAAHVATADPHTQYQKESEKNQASGYAGIGTGLGLTQNHLAPPTRFSSHQIAMNAWLSRADTAVVKEVWIGDSMTSTGGTVPETYSCASIYENEMIESLNDAPRGFGFVPVRQYNTATFASVGLGWDTVGAATGSVNGTNATRGTLRGPNFTSRILKTGESCTVTGDADTGITIFYSKQVSGGATATVTINGTVSGTTLDSRDAAITDPTGYQCGYSQHFARTPVATLGPTTVTVAHGGTGTDFELEGIYFHSRNSTTGYQLLRCDKSGQSLSALNNSSTPWVLQFINRQAPKIITIMCGVNDAAAAGLFALTAAQTATQLSSLITNIRALSAYSSETPAIRYVFQNGSSWVPAAWETDYRVALRQVCIDNDVLWIDGSDSNGPLDSGDTHDLSDDTLHPNDRGHWIWGQLVAQHTLGGRVSRSREVLDVTAFRQRITGTLGVLTWMNALGSSLYLFREPASAAVSTGNMLGALGFGGSIDAYSQGKVSAAIRGMAEENWTTSTWAARLEFMTIPSSSSTLTVRGLFDKDGHFYIGASAAGAVAKINQSTGALTLVPNVIYTDLATATYYDISSSFSSLGLIALKSSGGASWYLGRDEGSTTDSADVCGTLGFSGADDSAGTMRLSAAVRAKASAGFDSTHRESDLEFMTTVGTTLAVRAGVSNAGTFYVGATLAGAVGSIDSSGNGILTQLTTATIYGGSTAAANLSLNSTSNASKGKILAVDGLVAQGQLYGDTASGADLTLNSTSHATKGKVLIADRITIGSAAIAYGTSTTPTPVAILKSTATNDDPAIKHCLFRGTTTAATTINFLTPVTASADASFYLSARVVAHRTGGASGTAGDSRVWEGIVAYKQVAGTLTLLGAAVTALSVATATAPGAPAFVISGNQVQVQCTGLATTNYTWHVHMEFMELDT